MNKDISRIEDWSGGVEDESMTGEEERVRAGVVRSGG